MADEQQQLPLQQPEEKQPEKGGVLVFIRTNFVAGLLLLAPAVITLYILQAVVSTLDAWLLTIIPPQYRPETWLNYHVPGVGLVAGFLLILSVGLFARNFIGRKLSEWTDAFLNSIPGVRSIYSAVKQIINTMGQSQSESFREVVLVEYPRKGLWAIAFVTGKTQGEVQKLTNNEVVNVFLPTTPNPTSGFLLFIPKKDLIKLNMTVEQGIKMVISAGMVTPSLTEGKAALKHEKKVAKNAKKAEEVNLE